MKISYFEILIDSDGNMINQVIQRIPKGFYESRRMHDPAIVYSINLQKIIDKIEFCSTVQLMAGLVAVDTIDTLVDQFVLTVTFGLNPGCIHTF